MLFIKSTGTLNTIALWLSPLFIVFAIISMIWLSAKYRLTLVFIAPFIFSVIIGFSAPDRSVIVKMLSDGLGHYSGPMGALVNPLFITALIAAGGCVYALNKIKNFMQARSIKIILTGVGVVYSIIVTAIAAIFMIGFGVFSHKT